VLTSGSTAFASSFGLDGGVLSGSGNIQAQSFVNSALVSPGASPGTISLTGPYTQTAQGRLSVEVGGTAANSYDNLIVSGPVTLDGQLEVTLLNNYSPGTNDAVPIIVGSSVQGQFASVSGGTLGAEFALRPTYSPTAVLMSLQRVKTGISFASSLFPNGDVQLAITGIQEGNFTLQASTNFVQWTDILTVTNLPFPSYSYLVANRSDYPYRFFRNKQ
jgi:hypothetical protein